jgi:hypothetical protein
VTIKALQASREATAKSKVLRHSEGIATTTALEGSNGCIAAVKALEGGSRCIAAITVPKANNEGIAATVQE